MARLPRGRRHFQHGPIDLILLAEGPAAEVEAAYDRAWRRFETILGELVSEFADLRVGGGATIELADHRFVGGAADVEHPATPASVLTP